RLSACDRQAYQRIRAEPHLVGFTQPFITKNPAASVPLRNLEVGTIADSITAWLLESSNRPRRWIFLHPVPPVYNASLGLEVNSAESLASAWKKDRQKKRWLAAFRQALGSLRKG